MISKPLDELYFEWLYSQVGEIQLKSPRATFWNLFRELYRKEFVWFIPNDDNRASDGMDLRHEFLSHHHNLYPPEHWMELGCSFLEMLIAISRRLAFESDTSARNWFWHLINVLGLADCNDRYDMKEIEIEDVLDRVIWRTYNPDGTGGLFPLRDPETDQREVELWYQLNAYLIENDY